MKLIVAIVILACAVSFVAVAPAAEPKPAQNSAAEQELLKKYQEWEAAAVKGEGAAHFAKNATDDYVFTSADGVVSDKASCIAQLKASVIESWKIDDVQVRVYGDSLVATGRTLIKGKLNGKDVLDQVRFTETSVKRDGRWQPVALQFTRIAKP